MKELEKAYIKRSICKFWVGTLINYNQTGKYLELHMPAAGEKI